MADHLHALRKCLLVSAAALGAVFLVVFFGFSGQLMELLEKPLRMRNIEPVFITLYEPVVIRIKASFVAAVVAASPVIIAELWIFLRPALYPREGRTAAALFFVSLFLFLSGAAFACFVVVEMAINFFLVSGKGIALPFISIEKYVDFLFAFVLPFGLIFEVPVAMGVLTRIGIAGPAFFLRFHRYIILVIFIAAAILTPPDVLSQLLLALPLVILFETGMIVSRIVEKKRNVRERFRK
ncbi:MAG: twin-arginine translocase subunit TatC [Treponema sp.]|jgi:sec-independent protein translocase protein TatC|nr:twin-arginine translocase subunit TatC [Treponema sp.]